MAPLRTLSLGCMQRNQPETNLVRKEKTVGLLGASFDPITTGHTQLILDGARMFDELHICMAVNPAKKYLLEEAQREELVRTVVTDLRITGTPIHIHVLKNRLLVHLGMELGVTHLLRGVRDFMDFSYESKLAAKNQQLAPAIRTVYLTLPELNGVSSSSVKDIFGLEGWEDIVAPDVHPRVLDALKRKHLAKQAAEGGRA
jgi:pantetheine-phosphate adenylyltransferase